MNNKEHIVAKITDFNNGDMKTFTLDGNDILIV